MPRTLANYEQLFELSKKLQFMSGSVSDLRANGDSVVGGTEWEGVSANRFREFWKQFASDLDKAKTLLEEGSIEVNAKAELYQRADS